MRDQGRVLFTQRKFLAPALPAEDYLIPAKSIKLDSVRSNYYAFPAGDESSGLVINL